MSDGTKLGQSWKDEIQNHWATRILAKLWRKKPCGTMVFISSYVKPMKTTKKTYLYLYYVVFYSCLQFCSVLTGYLLFPVFREELQGGFLDVLNLLSSQFSVNFPGKISRKTPGNPLYITPLARPIKPFFWPYKPVRI